MASDQAQLDFVIDQISGAGEVSARRMFGEFGIYCNGKFVASVCDNQLFVKPTDAGRAFIGTPTEAPPYPGAKPHFLVQDRLDDREWLAELVRRTADALPAPKQKTPKRTTSKSPPKKSPNPRK